jgi:hypothetical protein
MAEFYLRHQGLHPYVRTFPGRYRGDPGRSASWAEPDPILGWTAARTTPEVNREGFRNPKDFVAIRPDGEVLRIMVLGDSFVYGAGVSADRSFPSLLQKMLGSEVEVCNLGVPGWGVDQMYLAYQRYRDIIQPAYVVLAFIDDDVSRVLESYRFAERLTKPSFAFEDGELVLRGPPTFSERLLNKLSGRSVLFGLLLREFYLAHQGRPIVRQIFRDMTLQTRSRGESFAIVRIPMPTRSTAYLASVPTPVAEVERSWNDFEELFEGTDVVYVDPWEEIQKIMSWERDLFLEDGHLSEEGHEFVARQILRLIEIHIRK